MMDVERRVWEEAKQEERHRQAAASRRPAQEAASRRPAQEAVLNSVETDQS